MGRFSITLTSNGISSSKNLSKLRVKAKRIAFRPNRELNKILKDLHFQYINEDPLKDQLTEEAFKVAYIYATLNAYLHIKSLLKESSQIQFFLICND